MLAMIPVFLAVVLSIDSHLAVCSPVYLHQDHNVPKIRQRQLSSRDESQGISSCGSEWMAIEDVKTNNGQITRRGYHSAVDFFCDQAGGQTVGRQQYLSLANRVWLDYGGNPATTGINGYVYFEIHNKQDSDYVVDSEQCKEYLKTLSAEGSRCYGKNHKDTKGGTWQVGSDGGVSYHALGHKLPPEFDALDKVVIHDGPVEPLGNGGKGNTLDPFPTYTFNDVTPIRCHSHNDYDRETALYSALTAGCISVEADVWIHGNKLVVGHEDPGKGGQTLEALYLDPIQKMLEEHGTMFPARPDQALSLLVDFKGNGDKTWDLLVKKLAPLRDAGYLSNSDGGEFNEGKLTVIASGNVPVAKSIDTTANPNRALFADARIHEDLSQFDASNAYFASANFKEAVQREGGGLKGPILDILRIQVRAAHDKGLKARYWDIPSEDQWQQLVDEGVDRLNVDDLQDVAKLDFYL